MSGVDVGTERDRETERDRIKIFTYKIHTDRGNVTVREGIVRESQKKRTFSYAGISDKEKLEKIIAVDEDYMLVVFMMRFVLREQKNSISRTLKSKLQHQSLSPTSKSISLCAA